MDGLQTIQDRILEQAREKADEIAEAAQAQCAEIARQAEADSDHYLVQARAKTREHTDAMLNRARSLASMESRKNILQKRQKLIDEVIDLAFEQTVAMEPARKLDLYAGMIASIGASEGQITLAASDLSIADQLLTRLGGSFTIAEKPGKFRAGLVLLRGKIEDNLTFDLIVRNYRPQLSALAAENLPASIFSSTKE